MKIKAAVLLGTLTALGVGDLILPVAAVAGGPFNFMNPSRWFGGNRDRYDDDYYYDRYYDGPGYGYGAPGYGYGAPGYGYGAPGYGYGAPGYGYGAPGYGYGAPGYGVPAQPAPATPAAPSGDGSSAKIKALEDRIKQLESSQPRPAYEGSQYPSTPSSPQSAPYSMPPASSGYAQPPSSGFRPTN